jgi:hypothetical protein
MCKRLSNDVSDRSLVPVGRGAREQKVLISSGMQVGARTNAESTSSSRARALPNTLKSRHANANTQSHEREPRHSRMMHTHSHRQKVPPQHTPVHLLCRSRCSLQKKTRSLPPPLLRPFPPPSPLFCSFSRAPPPTSATKPFPCLVADPTENFVQPSCEHFGKKACTYPSFLCLAQKTARLAPPPP